MYIGVPHTSWVQVVDTRRRPCRFSTNEIFCNRLKVLVITSEFAHPSVFNTRSFYALPSLALLLNARIPAKINDTMAVDRRP